VQAVAAAHPAGLLLAGVRVDEVRVDPQHDLIAQVTVGYPGRRDPAVAGHDQVPDPGPHRGAGGVDTVQGGLVDLAKRPRQGGR